MLFVGWRPLPLAHIVSYLLTLGQFVNPYPGQVDSHSLGVVQK